MKQQYRPVLLFTIYSAGDVCALLVCKEAPSLVGLFGEVHHEGEAGQANQAGDDALHDEDPLPAGVVAQSVHLRKSKCQNTGDSGAKDTDEVECGCSLVQIV